MTSLFWVLRKNPFAFNLFAVLKKIGVSSGVVLVKRGVR